MREADLTVALKRLNEGRASGTPVLPWREGRSCNYGTLGVDLQSALRWDAAGLPHGPDVFAERAENLTRAFVRGGLQQPIAVLHNAVRALAAHRI
eukprot:26196-Prymnesium_polylepis.1